MSAGDVSPEEVRWRDAAEQRSGQKQPFALAQELQQAVAAKQQDLDDMLRVRGGCCCDLGHVGQQRWGMQCRLCLQRQQSSNTWGTC
jgi:hypothetical protein